MAAPEGAKSMMVLVKGTRPLRLDPSKSDTIIFAGTVIVAEPLFCYIIVRREMVRDDFTYQVRFPDGFTCAVGFSLPPKAPTRKETGTIAGCYVDRRNAAYDPNSITAAQLGENVHELQEVYLCDFDGNQEIFLSPGRVNGGGEDGNNYFMHDCAPSKYTANGGPVFSTDGKLLGLCYSILLGACCADDMDEITKDLLKLDEAGPPGSALSFWDFVEQVKA